MALQVVDAPGANVVVGQLIADKLAVPLKAVSVTPTPVKVTFPVFVTLNE